ncbi:phosphate transporter PHO1 homolog 1-like, partial [Ananas comosus]|uniref:Phosphate transporter PHO1 homolog 1-like n=1 Tax=Ananas comosus TaxID=4615 RepID=A0A6P5EJQ0_ANACO
VRKKKLASSTSKGDEYETELLEQFVDTDATKEFFTRLDLQLNKVNQFYKAKEKDFLERGESLKKQMDILLELESTIKSQNVKGPVINNESNEAPSMCSSITNEEESTKITIEFERTEDNFSDSQRLDDSSNSMKVRTEEAKLRSLSNRVINCGAKNLTINIPFTTPSRTISAISDLMWKDIFSSSKKCDANGVNKLRINKTKLHHAEKMIKGGFIELYKGLGYLQNYRNLNMLAFVKILKKFDKVTGKQILPDYLKVVESSYFNSSEKAIKLMDEVEEISVKHFTKDDDRKAMKYLKPQHRDESHSKTFFIGLFTGCFIALFIGYCTMYRCSDNPIYMEIDYHVLRCLNKV